MTDEFFKNVSRILTTKATELLLERNASCIKLYVFFIKNVYMILQMSTWESPYRFRAVGTGGLEGPPDPEVADTLTLCQSGGADFTHHITHRLSPRI